MSEYFYDVRAVQSSPYPEFPQYFDNGLDTCITTIVSINQLDNNPMTS